MINRVTTAAGNIIFHEVYCLCTYIIYIWTVCRNCSFRKINRYIYLLSCIMLLHASDWHSILIICMVSDPALCVFRGIFLHKPQFCGMIQPRQYLLQLIRDLQEKSVYNFHPIFTKTNQTRHVYKSLHHNFFSIFPFIPKRSSPTVFPKQ